MDDDCANFFALSANELLALDFILALLLANRLNSNQLNILGNFLCGLGQGILTIQAVVGALPGNAVYSICSNPAYEGSPAASSTSAPENMYEEIQTLKERLTALEALLAAQKR